MAVAVAVAVVMMVAMAVEVAVMMMAAERDVQLYSHVFASDSLQLIFCEGETVATQGLYHNVMVFSHGRCGFPC